MYEKKQTIDPVNANISIRRQCELLEISRSVYYYKNRPMSEFNLKMMRLIDEIYTDSPDSGSRQIRDAIRLKGYNVNRKRIQRLMIIMRIEAIYPKRNLSKPDKNHEIYPYLLRNMPITHANQVWSTDITYVRLKHGFVYLVAIIDWYSRKILSWEVSTSLDRFFCMSALERAIRLYGKPEIFNSDQGSQFTSPDFTGILKSNEIRISMDGKGRAIDNIFIERFWRTIKYGEIYLKDYEDVSDAVNGIGSYIKKYNERRPHSSIDAKTPEQVYNESILFQKEDCKSA
mgnify:CR=1 FL=1